MKRRFFAFLIIFCLSVRLLPPKVQAASEEMIDVTFTVVNGVWDDGAADCVLSFEYGHLLTREDLPDGMQCNPNFGSGFWHPDPVGTEITEEITFKYYFEPLVWVTFDAGGGQFEDETTKQEQQLICGRSCGELPEEPVRDGCFFMGWYTGQDGFGRKFTSETVVSDSLTVYAAWSEAITVVFDGNNGKWTIQEDGRPVFSDFETRELPRGQSWGGRLPEEPAREGFRFDGWSLQPEGEALENTAVFDKDVTVFARWKPVFTLAFDGSGTGVTELPAPQSAVENTFLIPRQIPQREGCDFLSWNTLADGTGESIFPGGEFTVSDESSTLYAVWQRRHCTAAFEGFESMDCLWGDSLGKLPEPEEFRETDGAVYRFDGWRMEDGSPFTADTPVIRDLTLSPSWIRQVHVTFRAVNGTWAENGETEYTVTVDEGADLADKMPSLIPDEGFKAAANRDAAVATEDAVYTYACDPLEIYTLTLRLDGAVYEQRQVTEGRPIGILPVPEQKGKRFMGWYTDENAGENPESTAVIAENTTLYGRWGQIGFRLRYDANGGAAPPETEDAVSFASPYLFTVSDAEPTRTGYVFRGWAWAQDAEEAEFHRGDECPVDDEATLYAVWEPDPREVTVIFLDQDVEYDRVKLTAGSALTLPKAPDRRGFSFLGWNTRADGTGDKPEGDDPVTADLVLYAQWASADTVTVTFVDRDTQAALVTLAPGQRLGDRLPPSPLRDGYVFCGWNTRPDGTGEALDAGTVITETGLAYACWTRVTDAVVTFADRDEALGTVTLQIGAQLGRLMPPDPVRSGFRFLGWNTREDGTGKKVYKTTIIREDTVLFAQWEEIQTVTLTFVDRDNEVDSITLELGQKPGEAFPDNPVRSGWSFKGWYTQEQSGGRRVYKTTAIREDMTVYARWARKSGNPKTGDTIPFWASLLLISGAALGGTWAWKKRRK